MEKKKVFLGVLFVAIVVLLTFLRVAYAVDGTCCDWWTETVEWPVGASQCPATPDGANATYCCGLCYAAPRSSLEEAWEACPDDDEEEEELPVASGSASSSSYLGPALALIIPGVFLIIFFCTWLWVKDEHNRDHGNISGPVGGARSQLRSRDPPPRYGACSMPGSRKFMRDTQEPQDAPSLSGDTRVWFFQPTGEDGDDIVPPRVILGAQEEEPASGSAQEEEPASGGAQEEEPASGSAQEEEPASGSAQEEEPASGGAQEEEPASGGAQEEEPASGGAQEEEPASGGAQEEEPALPTE